MKKQVCLIVAFTTCFIPSFGRIAEPAFDDDDMASGYESNFVTPQRSPTITSYILRLRFPASVKVPTLCGYYKGYRLNFNTDFCLINEKTPSDTFTLVISDEIHRRWQNDTTVDLKRTGKKCRMFYITKKYDGTGQLAWDVEEEKESNIPVVLPKASLIIIMNPDLVKEVKKNDGLMKMKSTRQHPLHLPIIEIKSDITQEQLKQACTEAWCSAVDVRGAHSPVSSSVKKDETMIVAMNMLER